MKQAVSISLGSSTRDKKVVVHFNGEPVSIERIGTDGDEVKARDLFAEMDGTVDAFGVGGVELDIRLGDRVYLLRSGQQLVQDVKKTPAVCGAGLKNTLERRVFELAAADLGGMPHYDNAFMTLGVDRYGMATSDCRCIRQSRFWRSHVRAGHPHPYHRHQMAQQGWTDPASHRAFAAHLHDLSHR